MPNNQNGIDCSGVGLFPSSLISDPGKLAFICLEFCFCLKIWIYLASRMSNKRIRMPRQKSIASFTCKISAPQDTQNIFLWFRVSCFKFQLETLVHFRHFICPK